MATFTLPEKLTAETVVELHMAFSQKVESCDSKAVIDSGELIETDLLGLQFLAVLVADLARRSVVVVWDNLSIDLYQSADELGLCGALQLEL
ncbi:STAS domain-containing protein [Porticoccaceae bacterium LTM1]|nr:STAS domain-containing protein [Porticoccaceae bacterium LTM1]